MPNDEKRKNPKNRGEEYDHVKSNYRVTGVSLSFHNRSCREVLLSVSLALHEPSPASLQQRY